MSDKPNQVFLFPDQLRADFLGCYGANFVDTPHIDSLAQQGVLYERAYSQSPICVPARAALMTGLNAIRNGVTSNAQWLRPDLAACGIRTWPEMLAGAGYYTAAVGKMHFYPWDLCMGFNYRVAAEDKRWLCIRDDYYRFLRENGYRKFHGDEHDGYHEGKGAIINRIPWEYSADHFTGQEACRFIRTFGNETPFAMMVGFPGPHCPYDPTPEFLEGIDPDDMPDAIPEVPDDAPILRQRNIENNRQEWNGVDYTEFTAAQKKKVRAHYAALVKQIDYEVGQILSTLKEKGRLDNTIVIFSSDHGDYLGDHGLIGKGSFFESSIRVPLIVRLPWADGAARRKDLVELGDITSTMLHFGGCEIPGYMDSMPLPGLDIPNAACRKRMVGMTSDGWMLYDGTWKLCKYETGETLLFNLAEDPAEQRNLMKDPRCLDRYMKMDAQLTQEIMRSLTASHKDKGLDFDNALWRNKAFGKEGWQRNYPNPIDIAAPFQRIAAMKK